jgi:peptidoglycan hydrolase CwlO-like protein
VAHGSVRLALLNGEFRYREAGLLDGTHLRFFTRDSVRDLFESTGYVISTWLRRHGDIAAVEIPVLPSQVPPEIWERLKADPEATTYQFVVRAVPAGSAAAIHHLRSEKDALELDVRRLEQRLELQQQEVDALRAQATSFPDEIAQRDAWVAELQHEIERRDAWVTELQHEVERRDAWVTELQHEVERRDAWVTELQHTVEQHASSIAELQHGIERRDGWVADLQGEVERRDTWVASLRQEVERRDGLIDGQQGELARARNQLQQEVRERDARIVQLQQEVAGRDERLQAITASRLWRCAQAYWKVRRRLTGTETGSPSPAPGPE